MIDTDRDILGVAIEHFDLFHSITKPSWFKKWWNKLTGKSSTLTDSNVKEFGALVIQEMDRLGINVICIVKLPAQVAPVSFIIDHIPMCCGMPCQLVTETFRLDWAYSRDIQFIKTYEDLKKIILRFDDAVEVI